MSRPRFAADDRTDGVRDDPVRLEAYNRAMDILRNSPARCRPLSREQIQELRRFDGPELAGRHNDMRRGTKN